MTEHRLSPEQAKHSAAVRAALTPSDDGHGRWTILVYCDDESHEKPWNIGEFRITTQLCDEWLSFWMYHERGARRRYKHQLNRGETSVVNFNEQHLAPGDRFMRKPREFGTSVEQADVRYPLRCPKCGLSMPWRRHSVRREDALQNALDDLAIAGESDVALSVLRRIVQP
jgi:hypothetical protein